MSACIAIIAGVAALGLLANSGNQQYEVIIPQQVGQGTNVVTTCFQSQNAFMQPQQSFGHAGHAHQQGFAPQQFGTPQQFAAPYGGQGVGASIVMNGQSAIGAGTYANGGGMGVGANIGGIDASIGTGPRSF